MRPFFWQEREEVRARRSSGGAVVAFRVLLLLMLVTLSQACEKTVVTPVDGRVEVVPAEVTLVEGNRETFSAVLRETSGEELSAGRVTWTVENPEVASISAEGVVEALSPGSTRIRASVGDVSGSAEVEVLPLHQDRGPACEIRSNSISGDLRIPPNTTCALSEVEVTGHLLLAAGASITGTDVRVSGNVEGKQAGGLTLTDASISGDLKLEDGADVTLHQSHVRGKVELKGNVGSIELRENVIEDDVKLEKNRAGPFRLVANTIDGKLECKENTPLPSGSGNIVEQVTGQCSGL